jgi:hypothetical protein
VSGVPDEAIGIEIEGQVQGQAEFDHAQVAGEVSRPDTEDAHQLVAHLLGELFQLPIIQLMEIGWGIDPG